MKRPRRSPTFATLCFVASITAAPALGGGPVGGTWVPQGPGPSTGGQVEGLVNGEVVGAIQTVVAHPTNADILYVGGVNGGIWKTTNATAVSPTWTFQSAGLPAQSIGALDLDPTDPTHETLVAGVGRFSSFGRIGAERVGIMRTTDGGINWTLIDDGGALDGLNIYSVVARGATIVISADSAEVGSPGIYRSTDTGANWTLVSTGDGTTTGLPAGTTFDISGRRANPALLFTAVVDAEPNGGVSGVYRSADTGASWTKVSSATVDAAFTPNINNLEIALGNSPNVNVYVGIVTSGALSHVFRSANNGISWSALDLPSDGFTGIHPGGQGSIHFSLVAEPSSNTIVYIGGDRQDFAMGNGIGATDFSGKLFRGDASQPSGSQWAHLTHSSALGPAGGGTASGSSPHADSRDMAIDANGELIETDDGGIYRRTSPLDNTGDWFSINGNLRTSETHNSAYDTNSDIVMGGHQDTGTSAQVASGVEQWASVSTADGGDVGIEVLSAPGFSTRFSSFQGLGAFRRQVWDANNVFQSQVFPALTVIGGGAPLSTQFVTPIKLNVTDGNRILIGGANGVYESFDQGDTITQASTFPVNGGSAQALLYGAADNPNLIWAGSGTTVNVRTGAPPAAFTTPGTYPGTATVRDFAIDPTDSDIVFVVDSVTVFQSTDGGATWTDIGAPIAAMNPGLVRSIAFVDGPLARGIAVGTSRQGVLSAFENEGFATWRTLGGDFPATAAFDLQYDPATDTLIAGSLGNGTFRLSPVLVPLGPIFSDGFESGNTSAWSATNP